MITEIRFYHGTPSAEGVDFRRNHWRDEHASYDRVECNDGRSVEARWFAPGPVVFSTFPRKCMLPFVGNTYQSLDDLAVDIRRADVNLIDMRQTIGLVRDLDHFHELFESHALERFLSETIFIKREPDGTHGDIWQVSERTYDALRARRLISREKNNRRQTFVAGRMTFDELNEWAKEDVLSSFKPIPPRPPAPQPPPIYVMPTYAKIDYPPPLPRPRKPREARIDVSAVFAHDDEGKPITELDLTRESTRAVPRNMPTNLIPEAPDGCSDNMWEKLMLAEQIKFRRRNDAKTQAGG